MLHIAIVDDEAGVCGQIEMLIQEYAEKQKTEIEIDVLFSGEELIRFLSQRKSYDLILLDIELAELNGVAVGKIIREKFDDYATKIAYVSGKTHYAMELFQISPIDFLKKPVNYLDIEKLFTKLLKITGGYSGTFSFKYMHNTYQVSFKDILYFQSDERKIRIITSDREYEFYGKLDDVHNQLHSYTFIRIHKSYIVNAERVKVFKYQSVIMENGEIIPISQSKRAEMRTLQIQMEKESLQ